ncbi:MAG: hypothetical protein KME50_37730, partial [Nostoc desertorum CM1-VF14]|nr:hypothetical protein [Nostoc desertorum CM1-VF14]
ALRTCSCPLALSSLGKLFALESITPNSSQLCWQFYQCVPRRTLSLHTAPDVLSLRFCSCVCNRGNSRELLQDYFSSS